MFLNRFLFFCLSPLSIAFLFNKKKGLAGDAAHVDWSQQNFKVQNYVPSLLWYCSGLVVVAQRLAIHQKGALWNEYADASTKEPIKTNQRVGKESNHRRRRRHIRKGAYSINRNRIPTSLFPPLVIHLFQSLGRGIIFFPPSLFSELLTIH